jgi:hypothetical protein
VAESNFGTCSPPPRHNCSVTCIFSISKNLNGILSAWTNNFWVRSPVNIEQSNDGQPKGMAGTKGFKPNTIYTRLLEAQDILSVAWSTKNKTKIDIAVTKWASLVSQTTRSQKEYEPALSTYAVALLLRWTRLHRIEDLDLAIRVLEQAVTLPASPQHRFDNLVNLGAAFMDRWETFRRIKTIYWQLSSAGSRLALSP